MQLYQVLIQQTSWNYRTLCLSAAVAVWYGIEGQVH